MVVAGAGANIFSAHRPGLEAIGAEVVAVQDVARERVEPVAAEFGCPIHESVGALLEEPADLAVILAPHPYHAEIAVAALEAGKHALCEKPIAVEVAEADRMLEAADRAGRVLAVAFQQRTRPEVKEARRLIADGFLGRLQRADVVSSWPRRRTYFDAAPWRGSWRGEGGGVLINQGQHELDLLCHLAGSPARLTGWTRTRLHPIEGEDSAVAILEWADGALGSIHVSSIEVDLAQRLELTGTAGRIRLLPGKLELDTNGVDFLDFVGSDGPPFGAVPAGESRVITGGGGGHVELYRDLAEALASGRAPISPGRQAVPALELANAIVLSSRVGSAVELPLDRAGYSDLLGSLRGAAART